MYYLSEEAWIDQHSSVNSTVVNDDVNNTRSTAIEAISPSRASLSDVTNNHWLALQQQQQQPHVGTDSSSLFSRKVFIGGLPPDIDEATLRSTFAQIGHVTVDWPHKDLSTYQFPPQGYAFLIFDNEQSVQQLLSACTLHDGKYYLRLSSLTIKNKPVQVRPWFLSYAEYCSINPHLHLDWRQLIDHRRTVFVGGVPRPTTAEELALVMHQRFGDVIYVSIDVDADHKYPKGAGRVCFISRNSYVSAVTARFVTIRTADTIEKQMELKPFVVEIAPCDSCDTQQTRQFCASVHCLRYLCDACWQQSHHVDSALALHKPMIKNAGDRVRRGNAVGTRLVYNHRR